jgi:hypothetical protein
VAHVVHPWVATPLPEARERRSREAGSTAAEGEPQRGKRQEGMGRPVRRADRLSEGSTLRSRTRRLSPAQNGKEGSGVETRPDLREDQTPEGESSGVLSGRNRPGRANGWVAPAEAWASGRPSGRSMSGQRTAARAGSAWFWTFGSRASRRRGGFGLRGVPSGGPRESRASACASEGAVFKLAEGVETPRAGGTRWRSGSLHPLLGVRAPGSEMGTHRLMR